MCGVDGEAAALMMEVSPYPLPLAPACNLDITPSCVASVEQPELKRHRQRRGSGKPREPGALTALPSPPSAAIWLKERNKPLSAQSTACQSFNPSAIPGCFRGLLECHILCKGCWTGKGMGRKPHEVGRCHEMRRTVAHTEHPADPASSGLNSSKGRT